MCAKIHLRTTTILACLIFVALGFLLGCIRQPDLALQGATPTPPPIQTEHLKENSTTLQTQEAQNIALLLTGSIALQMRLDEAAFTNLLEVAKQAKLTSAYLQAMDIALHHHWYMRAREAAKYWHASHPNDITTNRALVILMLRTGEVKEVLTHLDKFIRTDRSFYFIDNEAPFMVSECEGKHLPPLLEAPDNDFFGGAIAYYLKALCSRYAKKTDEAMTYALESLRLDKTLIPANIIVTDILLEQNETAKALKLLIETTTDNPNSLPLILKAAYEHMRLWQHNRAESLYKQALKLDPNNHHIISYLVALYLQKKDYSNTQSMLENLAHHPEAKNWHWNYLGKLAEAQGHNDRALDFYSRVSPQEEAIFYDAQLGIAHLLVADKKIDEAIKQMTYASKQDISQGLALTFILHQGSILVNAKRLKDAYDLYTEKLVTLPKQDSGGFPTEDLLYARSLVAERMGELSLALKDLRFLIEKDTRNWRAMNAFGYLLAKNNLHLQEAKKWITRALDLSGGAFEVIDSMGWVEYRLGNYIMSEVYLRKAARIHNNPEVMGHLIEVLATQNKFAEARAFLKRALEQHPLDDYLLDIQKLLLPKSEN